MDQTSESEKVFQRKKYEEIIEILLTAGYFRCRINTLTEFDKVVGGLCWCITSTGEDVDVDILFTENSTIGQKIALSESIVKALRKMACPSQLQPHQIQGGVGGSDYSAIHPVIVWLVKKFFERKDEREDQLRRFSTMQFSRNFGIPNEGDTLSKDLESMILSKNVTRAYRRTRGSDESEEVLVRSCLLEYGEVATGESTDADRSKSGRGEPGGRSDGDAMLTAFEKKLAQAQREATREEEMLSAEANRQEAAIMKQMQQISAEEDEVVVSGSQVGAIVGMGSSAIGSAAAAYEAELEEARKVLDSSVAGGKLGQIAAFKRQQQTLLTSVAETNAEAEELQLASATLKQKLKLLLQEREEALQYASQLKDQLVKLGQMEAKASQQGELKMLKDLVSLNESLKTQESSFKASCKAQMADYNARIKALEESNSVGAAGDEEKKFSDIEDMHTKVVLHVLVLQHFLKLIVLEKYNKIRQLLADSNLEVANTTRIIDDIPTRSELIQYERRFVELYHQVAYKLEETKKYFAMYNTLDTTLGFLQKELPTYVTNVLLMAITIRQVKVLNSVNENFEMAMQSPENKAAYLQQFESIVRGVEQSSTRQESTHQQKTYRVDELKTKHQQLIDEQRRYFKAVKDFQEECNKNEWLTTKLEQMKHQ
ncbi:unnamed protein product [Ectocarpus fasciculatus]